MRRQKQDGLDGYLDGSGEMRRAGRDVKSTSSYKRFGISVSSVTVLVTGQHVTQVIYFSLSPDSWAKEWLRGCAQAL